MTTKSWILILVLLGVVIFRQLGEISAYYTRGREEVINIKIK
ncbi:hypothetical protein [uncultured Clostridium sp.]|jgi:hypothetical protein|nr:hypothetical protein [uncultured Clostridium sp.]